MKKRISTLVSAILLGVCFVTTTVGATVMDTEDSFVETVIDETAEETVESSEVAVEEVSEDTEETETTETTKTYMEDADVALEDADGVTFTPEELAYELSATSEFGDDLSNTKFDASVNRILFIGDSTCCGDQSFPSYFKKYNSHIEVNNVAVGGATYSTSAANNAHKQLSSVDLSNYDAVVILFGVNDFYYALLPGNSYSTDTKTVGGSLDSLLTKIKKAGLKAYVCSPFPCEQQFTLKTNTNGYYFTKYVSVIKNVTAKYSNATLVDFNGGLGVTADNFGGYYVDSCHPAPSLHMIAAQFLTTKVKAGNVANNLDVYKFVGRLYQNCLGRDPDDAGHRDWAQKLINKEKSGAEVAAGFFFSEEMSKKKLSNAQFVDVLYTTMMDRTADKDGKDYWVLALESGMSRYAVFKGFAYSTEFARICSNYGIERGDVNTTEGRDRSAGCTIFVARLYTKALGRPYDIAGLNDWCNRILDGKISVKDASTTGFFHSPEFMNKNTSDEEYVKILYRTFLGREAEAAGLADWVGRLANGVSRDTVLDGFAESDEFKNLRKAYGL